MDWKKIKEEPYRAGFLKIIKRTFELPDGDVADFDIKQEGPSACVLALDENDNVILVRQYRPGPEKTLSEMPGGFIKQGEEPEAAIRRELLEETGCQGEMEFVGTSLDDAYSTMLRYNFVAKNCKKIQEPNYNKNEFGEVVKMPLKEFKELLRKGDLTDVETGYMCLDHLKLL